MVQKAEGVCREEQVVVFELAGQTYGVEIGSVSEIIRMENITIVPRAPEFVEGVINLRGRIVPVLDLRKRFGLPEGGPTRRSRIIITEIGGMTVGMIVDAVLEVLRVPVDGIEPPPPVVDGVDVFYLRGITLHGERLVILLDLEKVLYEEEREALTEAGDEIGLPA